MFFEKMFLHIFHTCRSKYRWVLVKCCTKEILCAHRLLKIEGILVRTTLPPKVNELLLLKLENVEKYYQAHCAHPQIGNAVNVFLISSLLERCRLWAQSTINYIFLPSAQVMKAGASIPPKVMMHIPPISAKFTNVPVFSFFFVCVGVPLYTLTIMHLHIMLNTYWTFLLATPLLHRLTFPLTPTLLYSVHGGIPMGSCAIAMYQPSVWLIDKSYPDCFLLHFSLTAQIL